MNFQPVRLALEGSTAFETRWVFTRWDPVKNDRPDADETFSIDDLVECSLRELLQNILDSDSKVLRIKLMNIPYEVLAKAIALDELRERGAKSIRDFEVIVDENGMVPCMAVEDEGCGLGGPFHIASRRGEVSGGFQSYVRGTGNSSKDNSKGGSKGLGRMGIMRASSIGTVIVETKRTDKPGPDGVPTEGETLVFGLSHLDMHDYLGVDYLYDGRFMKRTLSAEELRSGEYDPLLPYIGDEGHEIMASLGCKRAEGVDGTTQFYPSIKPEVTFTALVGEIVRNHFIPILRGLLVTVEDFDGTVVTIDRQRLALLASDPAYGGTESHGEVIKGVATVLDGMDDPMEVGSVGNRIADHPFSAEAVEGMNARLNSGSPVCVKAGYTIRKNNYGNHSPSSGHLKFGIIVNPRIDKGLNILLRGGICLPAETGQSGVVTLSISESDDIHNMLRSGEDVSHCKWSVPKMKKNGWPQEAASSILMDFKAGAKNLYEIIVGTVDETENDALADIFGMPDPDGRKNTKKVTAGDGDKPEPDPRPEPGPDPKPDGRNDARFTIENVERDARGHWGVALSHSTAGLECFEKEGPGRRLIGLAYGQAEVGRSTWNSHSPADFTAHEFDFEARGCTYEVLSPNVIAIDVADPDFKLAMRANLHPDRMLRVAEVTVDQS